MENFRLKVFRVVAKYLNFRRASEELFITQPAVTQQIKALEEEIGAPLFDRSRGRVSLTEHGSTLLTYAERLKETADDAVRAMAEISGNHGGDLSVGASQTIGQYLLPKLLAGFLKDNPFVRMTAMSGNTEEVLDALAERRIQIALIEGPTLRPDVKTQGFMEDQMVLVVPAGHDWAEQEIDPSSLLNEPLLTREHGSGSRRVVEQALQDAGINVSQLRITMTLDSTEGLLSAVEAELGVAFVSRWAVRNQLSLGTLKVARVRGLKLSRMLSIAHSAGPVPQGSAGAFHRFVLDRSYDLAPRVTGKRAVKASPRAPERSQP